MASIINASTSSGLVTTADTSGILQLQSNGTTIATISSTGLQQNVGAPAFSAYLTSNQSVTVGTWTKVTQDTEEFDTNNNFASSRFTPTVAGYYQINACIRFNSSNTITRSIVNLYKNGSEFKTGNYFYVTNSVGPQSNVLSTIIYLNGSTDYVELYGYMDGSGTLSFLGGSAATYFNGSLIRSA